MNIGLYIHIPFCRQKCLYCDFCSYADMDHLHDEYVAALCREITGQGGIFDEYVIDTIYIGGGTPTLLSASLLVNIMDKLKANLRIATNAEVSIEANPGTVDYDKLLILKEHGINRLSFGVQSFSSNLLKKLGRIHSPQDAVKAVELAQKAGFGNVSIDLMYGLPGQTLDDLKSSINQAIGLEIQHLSIYGLKVEEGTPFFQLQAKKQLELPSDVVDETMYDFINQIVPAMGFARYEISNYAKSGYECRHNMKYWLYQPYIGVGTAAHSFINDERRANISQVDEYIYKINQGKLPIEYRENVDVETSMAEFIFLALRTVNGMSLDSFREKFGVNFLEKFASVVESLQKRQLISVSEQFIRLTELGMKYGNVVFASFLPD